MIRFLKWLFGNPFTHPTTVRQPIQKYIVDKNGATPMTCKNDTLECEEKLANEKKLRKDAELALEQIKLDKFIEDDNKTKEDAKNYKSIFTVNPGNNGTWLIYKDLDVFFEHIAEIRCIGVGFEPCMAYFRNFGSNYNEYAKDAENAIIQITMFSGIEYVIGVNRHLVDFVLADLRDLWRNYR